MISVDPPKQTLSLTTGQVLQQAVKFHQAGQFQDAERCYNYILQTQPKHPDANHNMGVLAVQLKRPATGLSYFKTALETNPEQKQFWLSYINALIQAGETEGARQAVTAGRLRGVRGDAFEILAARLDETKPDPREISKLVSFFDEGKITEAAKVAQDMTRLFPRYGYGWKALGVIFQRMGCSVKALAAMQKAAELLPGDADIHNDLGNSFHDLARLAEAEASYRTSIMIEPNFAEAHSNLGNTLRELGRLAEAESTCRRALAIKPNIAEAHFNLGVILNGLGRLSEAEASCISALELRSDYVEAINGLAYLYYVQGKHEKALKTVMRSLDIGDSWEAKSLFTDCVKQLQFYDYIAPVRIFLVRALSEPWSRPSELARAGATLVKLNSGIATLLERAYKSWPQNLQVGEIFYNAELIEVITDPLLAAILDAAPICDIELEGFLTYVRAAVLDAAIRNEGVAEAEEHILNFCSALARQCFINEYVFTCTDNETLQARSLLDSVEQAITEKSAIPGMWLIVLASYYPLHIISQAERLLERSWPDAVSAVLTQQICEPKEEWHISSLLPRLTSIESEISLKVQNQYEENPYPRWIKVPPAKKAATISGFLRERFPHAVLQTTTTDKAPDILIAGCGTGQQSINTAQRFEGANILAVDLSLSSLSYAKRKSDALSLSSLEYAQADLLKLGTLERRFDLVESSGVLHHLADPFEGWRILLSTLRPSGFMRLGFYSEIARRDLIPAREFIAKQGYKPTTEDIRRCRKELLKSEEVAGLKTIVKLSDYYSVSECRDLLFHVQEHALKLSSIKAFIIENNLQFLGFDISAPVLYAYRSRFPDDLSATNLDYWQDFENENPNVFICMYQFWVQKPGPLTTSGNTGVLVSSQSADSSTSQMPSSQDLEELSTLFCQGRYSEMESIARSLTKSFPVHGIGWKALGTALQLQRRTDEALESLQKAAVLLPQDANVANNLGIILKERGLLDEALSFFKKALSLTPDDADVLNNLGNSYRKMGRLGESVKCYGKALKLSQDCPSAEYNLGSALLEQGKFEEAAAFLQSAVSHKPDYAEAHNDLGKVRRLQGRLSEAAASFKKALVIKPDYAMAYNNLASVLKVHGKSAEAIDCYRQALALDPTYATAFSNMLFAMQYTTTYTSMELYKEHLRFARQFEEPLKPHRLPHLNSRDPDRRLKIGYVSPDFNLHAVAYFSEPVLANHEKSRFEIFCYYNGTLRDRVTEKIESIANHWISCRWMTDEQLAERIRSDRIDILIDLAGHTAGNRLLVFARKPAPVQVTWLGYLGTTGLSSMDYRFTDECMDPPGFSDAIHCEELIRLPHFSPFRPAENAPSVNELPALTSGHFILASMNNLSKLNRDVIALWGKILDRLPGSKLMLCNIGDAETSQMLIEMFKGEQVNEDRLILQPWMPIDDYLALHHQIDLALDPFPYNGGTITNHSLWMGVPVVTLAGDRPVSRIGVTLMTRAGLPEFITYNQEDYLDCVMRVAEDLPRLNEIRKTMRDRLASNAPVSPKQLTRSVEKAFRMMWHKWCGVIFDYQPK